MQISSSVPRFSANPVTGTPDEATHGAGFASLLRQRLPTPEPTLPSRAPMAAPAREPTPMQVTPPSKATAAVSATPKTAEAPDAPDAMPADDSAAAATAASPDAPDAATAGASVPPGSSTPADAVLRSQLRARLRSADARKPNDAASRDDDASAAATQAPPLDAPGTKKAATATLPDASVLASPAVPAPPVALPPIAVPPPGGAQPSVASQSPLGLQLPVERPPTDRAPAADGLLPVPADAPFAGVLADRLSASTPKEDARSTAIDAGTPTAVGAAAFGAAPTTGTAAPQAVAVATPVNAPNFAQHLGLQLSVLAKDGVQQAELHLNPADMGPVSVQITMDGTQARIDFGADVAATRHAIENGLPQLAGALADAGFTLAGGGVSSHAGGRGDGGGREQAGSGGSPRRETGVAATEVATPAARRVVTVGGLDLYA